MTVPDRLEVRPVRGLPDVRPGADLVALIAGAAPWLVDHDVVVVTSKVVSKAEGRLVAVPPDPDAREKARLAAVEEQTVREVARRGTTRIVETRHGLVLAAAGVDASNVRTDELALLPEDPDASARQLRDGLRRALGVEVAVVVSDTMGRPWRHGLVDQAIGVAGMRAVRDYRGRIDPYGNALARTEIAEADEVAAAAELVKGKLAGVPVAVVRGLSPVDDAAGARPLRRPAEQDMFRLGTAQAKRHAVLDRRSVRVFADVPVDRDVVLRAVAAAATAAAPRRTTPWRFVLVETSGTRRRLLEALRTSWVEDLRADGLDELRRGGVLERAPYLAVPCLVRAGARGHPDARRAAAEATAFHLAMGAGVQNFLVSLAAEGLGSCWVAAPLYCPDVVRRELELPADWEPTGAVAIGAPAEPLAERRAPDPGDFVLLR